MSIADKLRAARKVEVSIDNITFYINRATLEQSLTYSSRQSTDASICRAHVYGWDGVKESDLIDGGSDQDVPFSADVFSEIIGEKIDWWKPLSTKILEDSFNRLDSKKKNEKKSKSGSKASS